ncbi:HNH endonuclease [Gordonia phage Clown]|uniref:HNH endonuclease n=1 Tax=Gordonia phage Clown TaxID=2759393 RepID=A0A7L7SI00_9CAUD|nr:HNH endonuclease [Gordonia phage Clown]QOC56062.1 HNH endonuclease [Gordonia phage Clown]
MSEEEWRPVTGYEGFYEVSDQGRVRSLDRTVSHGTNERRIAGGMLAGGPDDAGYRIVGLFRKGHRKTLKVHHLVLCAFVSERPDGMEACHNNGNLADNRLSNLRWDTHSRNVFDSVRQDTHPQSSKKRCAQGHAYTPENTRVQHFKSGKVGRVCRTCAREWSRQYRLRVATR